VENMVENKAFCMEMDEFVVLNSLLFYFLFGGGRVKGREKSFFLNFKGFWVGSVRVLVLDAERSDEQRPKVPGYLQHKQRS